MADQALAVLDFSGGMTDNYVGGATKKFQRGDNLLLRPDLKIESRPGADVLSDLYYQLPVADMRVDAIERFNDDSIYQAQDKLFHVKASAFEEILGPDADSAFVNTVGEFDQASFARWSDHLIITNDTRTRPLFIYKDGTDYVMRTMGLPRGSVTGITHGSSGAASRVYRVVWKYDYTINGVVYEMRGSPSGDSTFSGTLPNNITNLRVLSNNPGEHYDVASASLVQEIYRTADAGDTFYKVGEVANGTTTFNDTTIDADLALGLLLYTDGVDLDYDLPPRSKYVVQLNGSTYYLNIKDSLDAVYPNRLVQAAPGQPYAANEGNVQDFDDEITGGAVAGNSVVIFTKTRTYRLDGVFDSTGAGGVQKTEISRTNGCVSHKSIVQVLDASGCVFASSDGFCFTDGYQVMRISEEFPASYKTLVQTEAQAKRIYAAYDGSKRRVYWAVSSDSVTADNDEIYVGHLMFGVKIDTPFTTWNGGYWRSNFAPTALAYYDSMLVRGDSRGYLLSHVAGTLNDVKIDVDADPEDWTTLPVIYNLLSSAFDFGDVSRRKWVTKIIAYADSLAKVAFSVFSNNDNSGTFRELKEIRSNSPILWGDPEAEWGDPLVRWNYMPIITGIRRFPANGIRCSYKQIQITNSLTQIENPVTATLVDINSTTKEITRVDASNWQTDYVDYFISFATDGFVQTYPIESIAGDAIVVTDTQNLLTDLTDVQFKVTGYRKNEAIRLLSYSLVYSIGFATQSPYAPVGATV